MANFANWCSSSLSLRVHGSWRSILHGMKLSRQPSFAICSFSNIVDVGAAVLKVPACGPSPALRRRSLRSRATTLLFADKTPARDYFNLIRLNARQIYLHWVPSRVVTSGACPKFAA